MSIKTKKVASLLVDLEGELRNLDLWSVSRPSDSALASVQPFCVDTLGFHQWLQFVFIEKIRLILEHEIPLPSTCAISPMAEEVYRGAAFNAHGLIALLKAIDAAISSN